MENLNLCYSIRKKTDKLLGIKEKLNSKKSNLILPYGLTIISVLYVILFNERYFNYVATTFSTPNKKIYGLEFFDIIMFILGLSSFFISWHLLNKYNNLKSSYEFLRKDIKKSIDNKLCNCSNPHNCNCKDEYIKFMESKGIDLIF